MFAKKAKSPACYFERKGFKIGKIVQIRRRARKTLRIKISETTVLLDLSQMTFFHLQKDSEELHPDGDRAASNFDITAASSENVNEMKVKKVKKEKEVCGVCGNEMKEKPLMVGLEI
ncbi:hypothetical protein HAX54_029367 [Datura stramonium]|uniref:Uncharacterized protein n=1 Tax=Datura stramonium TaxID=4076 RepID=A0ABS8V951_DATST|nr:hypothetical protein [Datura stramonium]